MMVLSVFAMSASFAGAAAAQEASTADRALATTEVTSGETVEVTIDVAFDEETEFQIVDTIDEELDAEVTSGPGNVDGNDVTYNFVSALGTSTDQATVTYDVTVPETADAGTTYEFDGTVQSDTSVSIDGPSTLEVVEGDDSNEDDSNEDDSNEDDSSSADHVFDTPNDLGEVSVVWAGQSVEVHGLDENSDIALREDLEDGDRLEEELSTDSNGVVEFDTDSLDGEYFLEGAGADASSTTFEVATQELNVEFDEDEAENDEAVDIEFDSNRGTYAVNVSSDSLDADELAAIFNTEENDFDVDATVDDDEEIIQISNINDGTFSADFDDVDTGSYDFDFQSTDTEAEANASIDVVEAAEGEVEFDSSDMFETRSNTAEITVNLEDTDSGYLKVGDEGTSNYEVYLELVDDNDDGVVTVEMDTTKAHHANGDAFSAANDDDAVNFEEEVASPDGELEAGEYELATSLDFEAGNTDAFADEEIDSAYLTLQDREGLSGDALITQTVPASDDLDTDDDENLGDLEDTTITSTNTIADGDKLLATLETDGLHTYFEKGDSFSDVNDQLESNDSLNLSIAEEDSAPNADPVKWNTNGVDADNQIAEHVTVVEANQTLGHVVFAIDYQAINNDDDLDDLSIDESYDVTFAVDDEFEYASEDAEDNEEATTAFDLEDREFELDSSNEELPASATATVTGDTNVAPGTEVSDRLRSPGNFTQSNSADVASDGSFEISHDLSEYSAGIDYTLSAEEDVSAEDDLEGTTIPADELQSFDYDVTTAPSNPTVGDNVTATITVENPNADQPKSEDVEFVFNGDTLYDETVELNGSGSDTISVELLENAEKGDYEWDLFVNGESREDGSLSVAEEDTSDGGSEDGGSEDGGSEDGGSEDGGSEDGGSEDGGSEDGGSEDGGSDETPGFGVGVALVALLGAAMLALRRQN
ncbi:BGTF surface domain-containing protein [Natrinema sp. SYSU A 869]|uniref:BGTF surface domain-containing protein n=1 Tax=Natrinema sp. SYSU A 869 TaxID=2871694 RepID=UPI002107FEDE|nr:BGTF surface domain-containing protein [Natrinema sp. SYSU A 869]